MAIHFAYSVPRSKNILRRGLDKAIAYTGGLIPPLHRLGWDPLIPWQHPIRAPHSISYHLLHAFKAKYRTRFYGMYEHTKGRLAPNDIFIGQPLPLGGFGSTRPDTDDPKSVTSRMLREHPNNRGFIIMPYAHDALLVSWARNLIRERGKEVIFIGGDIWKQNWEKSPFADLPIERKLHVDMGIDMQDYPLVKSRFNPPGKRGYLYIGHTSWYKNTAELERIAAAMPNAKFAHIGGGAIQGWQKLADFADLTPTFMSKLAEDYDIFVTVSTADAQATTILEQMCFGMVVACTPETGYQYPSLPALSITDTEHNVRILESLQQAPEDELRERVAENRHIAQTKHSWSSFCEKVLAFMEL